PSLEMPHTVRFLMLAMVALAAVRFADAGAGARSARAEPQARSADIVPNEVIVAYRDGWPSARSMLDALRATAVERLPSMNAERVVLPEGLSVDAAIARLSRAPGVAYVEPNVKLRAAGTPNDPRYPAE